MMAWGVEARVPFLDREFLEYAMTLDPEVKMSGNRIEKFTLRKAFDCPDDPYLPEEVLWRQKEEYMYRDIFSRHFPSPAAARTVPQGESIACSSPAAIAWDASFANMADPSGRAVAGVHEQAY